MRILAIRGQNLASLARSFELDLEHGPLAGVGLFAITGPVGAGKSTLLDALSLALFDRTPRLSGRGGVLVGDEAASDDECLRSNDPRTLLRRDAAEGHAEVDFSGRDGVRYRARWSVRRARRKVDGRVQDQEMSLLDLDRNLPVAIGRKTEVLAAIELRLGLDFQQFCRSVLLAQGEFAAFLRASPDERARLLENLTGADLYRRLSRAAHERRKVQQAEVDRLTAKADVHVLLEPIQRGQLETQVRQLTEELQFSQLAIDLAQRYVTWYASAEQLRQQESEATVRLQGAIDLSAAAVARRERCARLQRAWTLVPRADQVMEWQRRLASATGLVEQHRRAHAAAVAVASRARGAFLQQLAAVLPGALDGAPPLVADFPRWQGVLERWQRAREKRAAVAEQLPLLQGLASVASAAVGPLQQQAEAAAVAQRQAEAGLADAQRVSESPQFLALPQERRDLAKERQALGERLARLRDWQRCEAELARARHEIAAREVECEQLAAGFPELVQKRQAAEDQLGELRQQMEKLRARVDAAGLVHHLVDGVPCPLCGALEHPMPAAGGDVELRAAVAASRRAELQFEGAREAERTREAQRREAERARLAAVAASQGREAAVAVAQAAWSALAQESVAGRSDEAAEELAERQQQLQGREAQCEAVAVEFELQQGAAKAALAAERRAVEACRRLQGVLQQAVEAVATTQRAVGKAAEDLERCEVELAERTSELEPALVGVRDWETHLQALGERVVVEIQGLGKGERECRTADSAVVTQATVLAAAAAALDGVREELRQANASFETALQQVGVRPVEVREAGELGREALALEAEQLRELELAVVTARAVVQTRAAIRREHEASDRPELEPADAAQALDDARKSKQRIAVDLDQKRQELHFDDTMRRQRDELAPRLRAAEQALEIWAALDDLIGSSHGDAFAVFAQGLTLDLLLAEANRRLHELARRYQLQKNHGGEMDFVVVDLDLGGTRRSLQTLSGGETFLVSLSLALALATLAAPRSRVETLFLDEGFGTLDAQNLEQALGALDTLQAAGCQVGVISHVDGIAERIGAVVEVHPEGGGQSRVRVRV